VAQKRKSVEAGHAPEVGRYADWEWRNKRPERAERPPALSVAIRSASPVPSHQAIPPAHVSVSPEGMQPGASGRRMALFEREMPLRLWQLPGKDAVGISISGGQSHGPSACGAPNKWRLPQINTRPDPKGESEDEASARVPADFATLPAGRQAEHDFLASKSVSLCFVNMLNKKKHKKNKIKTKN